MAARRRILAAAAAEFARAGFAGARVSRIAAGAGINKRMLYHYYGDKQGLWQAVLDERLGQADAPDRADTLRHDPLTVRLLLWSLLQEDVAASGPPVLERLREGLERPDAMAVLLGALTPREQTRAETAKPRIRLKHRAN